MLPICYPQIREVTLMGRIRLMKSAIDKLPIPQGKKRDEYFDTELPGFGLRVTESSRIYFVLGRVNGQLIRYTIGKHGVKTPDAARKEAREKLVMMANGINPNRDKALARVRGITLKKALNEYFISKPQLRDGTKRTYKCLLNMWLSDWMDKPLDEIGKAEVSKRHLKIASERSAVAANNVMRTFRAVYNHAQEVSDGTLPENPTKRLSQARQWFQIGRRQTLIKEHELKAWHDAVKAYSNPVVSDALLLLLFTGCREQEVLTLQWEDVDMKDRTFTIRAEVSKNHREHTLPMSNAIFDIFNRRLVLRENEWVFPGQSESGHLTELKRALEYVINETKIDFCIHDLRRTFTSIAEQEVSYAVLKRLLNHYTGNDVTAGYLVISTEQLRAPMQKVTDRIVKAIKAKDAKGKVIPLRA
jgi:integrase